MTVLLLTGPTMLLRTPNLILIDKNVFGLEKKTLGKRENYQIRRNLNHVELVLSFFRYL